MIKIAFLQLKFPKNKLNYCLLIKLIITLNKSSLTAIIDRKIIPLNICRGETSSTDVRDVVTGEDIPFKKANNKYVVRVEPHRAILEPDYFIKMIEIAE